jgi:hypothetical protein
VYKYKTIELSVPTTKVSVRWRISPSNKFTRFFWGFINVWVEIDYFSLIQDREQLKDD